MLLNKETETKQMCVCSVAVIRHQLSPFLSQTDEAN